MAAQIPIQYEIDEVQAEKTAWGFSCILQKPNGAGGLTPIVQGELSSLTLTLYDAATYDGASAGIINSIQDENINNANHGVFNATSGLLTVTLHDLDNPIINSNVTLEKHVARIHAKYNSGVDSLIQEIIFWVKNLSGVS